jgi:hypothetical protein
MSTHISDEVKQIMAKPCFGFITAISEDSETFPSRHFGYQLDEENDEITVFLYKEFAGTVIANAQKTGRLAINAVYAFSFEALQFKGNYIAHWDATEEELPLIDNMRNEYNQILSQMQFPDNMIDRWIQKPSVAIKMRIDSVFNQTPAKGTGNKMS